MIPNNKLRIASAILALIGLVDALYLTGIKLTHTEAACIQGLGDCQTVNTSRYAEIQGIPVALLGALAYLAILFVLYLESKSAFVNENGSLMVFGIGLTGTLFSAYLTYLELAVIHAICPFCVLSAICMLTIFILSIVSLKTSHSLLNSQAGG